MSSIIKVDQIQTTAGTAPTAGDLGINTTGSVLQVKQAVSTSTMGTTGFNMVDATGLSVTITPKNASSTFLISYRVILSSGYYSTFMNLVRNNTAIFQGAGAGVRNTVTGQQVSTVTEANAHGFTHHNSATFLDSPNTTSDITYKIQISGRASLEGYTGITYLNRTYVDRNTTEYDGRYASNIVIQEIAG